MSLPLKVRTAPIARLMFWTALAFALVMALTPRPPVTVEVLDKWQHMAAFGTLSVLACAGWPRAERLRIGERLSFLGAMIEVIQSIPALHRDCDIMDWVADTAVVIGVLTVVVVVKKARVSRSRTGF